MSNITVKENTHDFIYSMLNAVASNSDVANNDRIILSLYELPTSLAKTQEFLKSKFGITYIPSEEQPFIYDTLWRKLLNYQFDDEEVKQRIVISDEDVENFGENLEWNIGYAHSPLLLLPEKFNNKGIKDIKIDIVCQNGEDRDYYDLVYYATISATIQYEVGSELFIANNHQKEEQYVLLVDLVMYKEDKDAWSPYKYKITKMEKPNIISFDNILFSQEVDDKTLYFCQRTC